MPDILLAQNQAVNAGQLRDLQCDGNGYLYVDVATGNVVVDQVASSTATAPGQVTLGTSAATALAANSARRGFVVQNQGTTVIKILLGTAVPTQSNYTVALPAGGSSNDGSSPSWFGPPGVVWTGAIQWISSAAGGLAEIVELT